MSRTKKIFRHLYSSQSTTNTCGLDCQNGRGVHTLQYCLVHVHLSLGYEDIDLSRVLPPAPLSVPWDPPVTFSIPWEPPVPLSLPRDSPAPLSLVHVALEGDVQ